MTFYRHGAAVGSLSLLVSVCSVFLAISPLVVFRASAASTVTLPASSSQSAVSTSQDNSNHVITTQEIASVDNGQEVLGGVNTPSAGAVTETVVVNNTTGNARAVVAPTVVITSRCVGAEDSLVATTNDPLVKEVYVYRSAEAVSSNLVAIADVVNGTTGEVYVGDNLFATLYVVAQDIYGNRSSATTATNDMLAPARPDVTLSRNGNSLVANWPAVSDAKSYLLRWRAASDAAWQERSISTTTETAEIDPQKTYEVSVASRDQACNQSESTTVSNAPTPTTPATVAPPTAPSTATKEAKILHAQLAKAGPKDEALGEVNAGNSVTSQNADGSKSNGNKNQSQDGSSQQGAGTTTSGTASPSPSPSSASPMAAITDTFNKLKDSLPSLFKNRSAWIFGLAILLIVIGAALALYSGFRGDSTPPDESLEESDEATDSAPDEEAAEESADTATQEEEKPKQSTNKGSRRGRGRRTKW